MLNPDILGKADKILRPVLKELSQFNWMRLEGCCAGHKAEDSLWIEVIVLGSSGLRRLSELLRILDVKLNGTDCRVDCLLSYDDGDQEAPPHGWIPVAIEVFWPARGDWRRTQVMVTEALMSSVAEYGGRQTENLNTPCAINYCPFCSSAFIRLDSIDRSGQHRYRCGDCDVMWTMIDPVI